MSPPRTQFIQVLSSEVVVDIVFCDISTSLPHCNSQEFYASMTEEEIRDRLGVVPRQ